MPKVSVLMPVYNGEDFIAQAISSVLSQSFRDFELVVIDDGSVDKSAEIVASYDDKRVRYFSNSINLGLSSTRNRAIELSSGEYLAWLDCDDISLPDRLLKQVAFLDENRNVGLCGTWVKTIGVSPEQVWRYPFDSDFVRGRMLFDDPVATSSAMVRRFCLESSELYFDKRFPPAEDYDLWERISSSNIVCNIPKILTLYRMHPNQISKIKSEQQKVAVWAIQSRLLRQLGIEPTEDEKALHLDVGVGWRFLADKDRLEFTEKWLVKLEEANSLLQVFPREGFRRVLAERWYLANFAAVRSGQTSWRRYGESELSVWEHLRFRRQVRLFLGSLCHAQ